MLFISDLALCHLAALKAETSRCHAIDHFHYDVTRAKVSGSCSKDRAQCRAIAGKCQKNQHKRHVGQGKLPGLSQSYMLDCYTNSKKFSVEFFFSINEELRRVLLTNISMENFFSKF